MGANEGPDGFGMDSDNDNLANSVEFLSGSNPTSNFTPYPAEANKTSVSFPATPAAMGYLGNSLVLQTSTSLVQDAWETVTTTITADDFATGVDRLSYNVSSLSVSPQCFFRLKLTRPDP